MMMGGFWGIRNEVWVFRGVAGGCAAVRGTSGIGVHCGCIRVVVVRREGNKKKLGATSFLDFTRCVITLRSRAFFNLHLHLPRTLSSSSHLALPTYYPTIIPTYLNSTQTPSPRHPRYRCLLSHSPITIFIAAMVSIPSTITTILRQKEKEN